MSTVQQLLDAKGKAVWSAHPDDTVFDAIQEMASRDVGSLTVMEAGRLAGIFTERHYARDVILKGKSSPRTPVRDVMTLCPVHTHPEATVEYCMTIMTEQRVRHLPVLRNGRLVGIVSIGDLVKSIIEEQKFTISQLELYIYG